MAGFSPTIPGQLQNCSQTEVSGPLHRVLGQRQVEILESFRISPWGLELIFWEVCFNQGPDHRVTSLHVHLITLTRNPVAHTQPCWAPSRCDVNFRKKKCMKMQLGRSRLIRCEGSGESERVSDRERERERGTSQCQIRLAS